MTSYVAAELRRLVEMRAELLCEYCLIHQDDTYLGCQVEHIISEKHGGTTTPDNLSLACTNCNRSKGSDVGSIAPSCGEFVRFYNPRSDHWGNHFALSDFAIVPRTVIGEATVRILRFNDTERLLERSAISNLKRYPPVAATKLMRQS